MQLLAQESTYWPGIDARQKMPTYKQYLQQVPLHLYSLIKDCQLNSAEATVTHLPIQPPLAHFLPTIDPLFHQKISPNLCKTTHQAHHLFAAVPKIQQIHWKASKDCQDSLHYSTSLRNTYRYTTTQPLIAPHRIVHAFPQEILHNHTQECLGQPQSQLITKQYKITSSWWKPYKRNTRTNPTMPDHH